LKQLRGFTIPKREGKKKLKKEKEKKKVSDLNYIIEQVMKLTLQNLKF